MSNKHAPIWPIYKRLLGYTRAYWTFMVAAVIAMVVEALAGYHFTKLMEPLVNRGFVNPEPRMAVILPLTILGLFMMRSLATLVSDYALARTGRSVVRDLREQVLEKYLHLPSAHFDSEATPVMVSRLNYDTEQVTQASADALKTLVADTLTIIAMLVVMLQMSVKVTVAMLVVVPLIGVIVSFVGKRYRRISRGIQDGMGSMAQTAEQSLAAQQEVKVHGTQAHEISRYSRLANRMLGLNM
ncbi:ABC transporter transmembrane domain-containing protein, partial [Stenotrophomonas sp. HMWF003]